MTTLPLDDKLAERLTHIAATHGTSLHVFATEAREQLAATALPRGMAAAVPITLADELLPLLERIWAAQEETPTSYESYPAPGTFGDLYEERLSQMWDADHTAQKKPRP